MAEHTAHQTHLAVDLCLQLSLTLGLEDITVTLTFRANMHSPAIFVGGI